MDARAVMAAAAEAGIGLDGIDVELVEDDELAGSGLYGYTYPDGRTISLYPDAFEDEEQLVKTLGHDRIHAYQFAVLGAPRDSWRAIEYEHAACATEEDWWRFYREQR
jgi:hypothetical protein